MKRTALITGLSGFVASHLAEALVEKGWEVHGTFRPHSSTDKPMYIADLIDKKKVTMHHGDLMDYTFVWGTINEVRPDVIFHLAAQSFVRESFDSPAYTFNNNTAPQLHIFEAVKSLGLTKQTVIHIAGSSEEYGMVEELECPITELNDLKPLSPYAVSKITQDFLAQQYHHSWGLKTVITRAFNHEGPRRGPAFAMSNWARQITMIEMGIQAPEIMVGDLTPIRDITDVRDMVQAYILAVEKCEYGTPYNICTGRGYSMQDVLDLLIAQSDIPREDIKVSVDRDRMRPSDVPLLIGSYDKFSAATGWAPTIPLSETVGDTLTYWRNLYGKTTKPAPATAGSGDRPAKKKRRRTARADQA